MLIQNFGNSSKMANFGFSVSIAKYNYILNFENVDTNCQQLRIEPPPKKVNKIITCFGHHVSFVHKN